MVIAVRTERGLTGLEIVKEADSDADRARLQRETRFLKRAAHPGVVEIASAGDSVLRLRHRGTSLARLGPLAPDNAAAIVRAVADIVHALHEQGIVHNRIDADHVVVDDRGRPRLCGFGGATETEGFVTIADEAASLGRLLDHLLDNGRDALWSPRYRGLRHGAMRKRALAGFRAAASQTQRADPTQRISTRQFAAALDAALPGLRLPALDDRERPDFAQIPTGIDPTDDLEWTDDDLWYLSAEDDDHAGSPGDPYAALATLADATSAAPAGPVSVATAEDEPSPMATVDMAGPVPSVHIRPMTIRPKDPPAPDRRVLIALSIAVLVLGAVAGSAVARSVRPFGSDSASASSTAVDSTDRSTTTTLVRVPPPVPPQCNTPELRGPDVDGDGCPEAVTLTDRTATVGTLDVELGQEGDLVVVADHDCDGVATPVLLRPSSGEVFVFPTWSLDAPLEIDASAVVPGGVSIAAGDGPCPSVTVTSDRGNEVVVAGPGS